MHRRALITTGLSALGGAALATPALGQVAQPAPSGPPMPETPDKPVETYSAKEIVSNVSDFLGVTAEAAAGVVEKLFKENGQPTAYIAGTEGSAAISVGARYGKGLMYMKNRTPDPVYWQGPSVGWDLGGNASRVFILVYNLLMPDMILQRFPGVEGSAYFVGGMGVNYLRGNGVTLAPMRAGVGLRLGANLGYLSFSRHRNWIPF